MNRILLSLALLLLTHSGISQIEFKFESVTKLPDGINSMYEEASPMFDPSTQRLYFTRSLHPENAGGSAAGQDLWYAEMQENGWGTAHNDQKSLNNYLNNAALGISADGQRMYMLGTYIKKVSLQSGLSVSHLNNGMWERPEVLKVNSLSIRSPFYGGYVTPAEDVMIISMESNNSKGEEDLYVSFKDGDEWSKPLWLGDSLNSAGYEISPFLFSDGRTLIFASNGHGGLGDCDIFYAYRKDSTWTNWTKPMNPGKGINSEKFDAFPFAVGDVLYFSSNRNDSLSNIYKATNALYYREAAPLRLVFETFETRLTDIEVDVLDENEEKIGTFRPGVDDVVTINGLREKKTYTLVPSESLIDFRLFKPLLLNADDAYIEELKYNDDGTLTINPTTPEKLASLPTIAPPEYVAGMQGILEVDRVGVKGVMVALEDENGTIHQYAKTQEGGAFKFAETADSLKLKIRVLTELEYIKKNAVIYYTDYRGNKLFKSVADESGAYKYQKLEARELAQLKSLTQADTQIDDLAGPGKGIFSYENLPKEGVKLRLYDENNNLIEEVVTNEKGEFVFSKLRPDQNFSIRPADEDLADGALVFTDEHGNPIDQLKSNEQGFNYRALRPELVAGLKLMGEDYDDNRLSQNFVFTIGLYKYKSLPKEGITLRLLDANDNVIESVTTDASGHFVFSMLKPNQQYKVQVVGVVDNELDETQLYFVDKDGTVETAKLEEDQLYTFEQLGGAYFFNISQINSDDAKRLVFESFKDVIGRFNYQNLPKSGVKLELMDENNKVIETVYTDEYGRFKFSKLAKASEYYVRIAEEDEGLASNATWEFESEEEEDLVQEGQTANGFKFVTLTRQDGSISGMRLTDNPTLDISKFLPGEMDESVENDTAGNQAPDVTERNEMKMRTIYFNFNSIRLSNNDRYHLNHSVFIPAKRSGQPVLLVGYSCDLGDPETAAEVALMRAQQIRQYLINLGMDPELIEVEGIGAPGESLTPGQRMERRRVDVYHLGL